MAKDETFETFPLGDWDLQSGGKIYDAHIAFKTFGHSKLPPIVYPTWFSGTISDNFWLIGENMTLNPENYFIIIPALFGNGQSSSPSNQGSESKNVPFPKVSMYDNVRAQHKLVVEHFGITHLRAVLGWSMGGAQTFQWASQYTDFMDLAIPFCGAAKVALHNMVMLEGVKGALLSAKSIPPPKIGDIAWPTTKGESYRTWSDQEKSIGLKAFGRAYAGWGFSQAFYRAKVYETTLGYKDLEDFMVNFWEKWACSKDPENMLVMLQTWQHADISKQEPYNGDFELALASIKAKTLVLPGKTDLYFPPEDSEYEVKCMKDGVGELAVFPSIWGHWAGGPGDSKEDVAWLDQKLAKFFGSDELCIR